VGDQWYKFDDNDVFNFTGDVVTGNAYVIFLVRKEKAVNQIAGHKTPWLRQQSVSMPELWPHPVWASQVSGVASALEKAQDNGKSASSPGLRDTPSSRKSAGSYVMALPDVVHDSSARSSPVRASGSSDDARIASLRASAEPSCGCGILKWICGSSAQGA